MKERSFTVQKKVTGAKHLIHLDYADTFFSRFLGLMGKTNTAGLLITKTNQIHTHFMRFPIDVYYLKKDGTILHIDRNVKPWRFCKKIKNAKHVIEFTAGFDTGLAIGDQIELPEK